MNSSNPIKVGPSNLRGQRFKLGFLSWLPILLFVLDFSWPFPTWSRPIHSSGTEELEYLLPKDTDAFFMKNYYTGVDYLHLKRSGHYERIQQTDLGTEETTDRGSWEQMESGEVLLRSESLYHDVIHEPLQISIRWKDRVVNLPEIKNRISEFLEKRNETQFTKSDVGEIHRQPLRDGGSLESIWVAVGVDYVSRDELEGLIRAIEEFLESEDKNVFRLTPYQFPSFTVLVWKNAETSLNRDLGEIRSHWKRLEGRGASYPMSVFVSIGEDDFNKGTSVLNRRLTDLFDYFFGSN